MFVMGTAGDDVLVGTPEGDTILGLGGNDTLQGGDGDDILIGGEGDDTLEGGAGADWLDGKGGSDVMNGGTGNDFLSTSGIFGPAAAGSFMIGGDGNDSIQSGNSNDTMLGGVGDDALTVGNYITTRTLDGGVGADLLAFSGVFPTGVVVDLNKTTQVVASGVVLILTNVENVNGTDAGDTLIGDGNTNIIYGHGGDDWLYGRDGNDGINAGDGDDYLVGGAGQDGLYGGAGADAFVFAPGDSVYGASDTISDVSAEDHIVFTDGQAGTSVNYLELDTIDFLAVDAAFASSGVRYVAMQVFSDVYLFADDGEEGMTYDQMIILTGANLSSIDAGSILGL